MTSRPHVVVITDDVLGSRMAGPAIRAVEIARALAADQPVTLVSAAGGRVDIEGVTCAASEDLRRVVEAGDVVFMQGAVMMRHPWLHEARQPIAVDLYDPFHLEALQLAGGDPVRAVDIVESTVRTLSDQIVRGDFFVCATNRQRDLWLGHLGALGRLNHRTREGDPDLRGLIDLVPFGVHAHPPERVGPRLREVFPAIGPDDVTVLWAGGIYDWFDPVILVEAVAAAADEADALHLAFLGGRHPNPDVPVMAAAESARRRARELGVDGKRVHFLDDWVPYTQRQQLLVDADIGVTTHHRSVETAFSFRTRMLDYLWAGLPIVCTGGDELSSLVASTGAGRTVEPDDVDGLRRALVELANDADARTKAATAAADLGHDYRWADVVEPLRRFTLDPHVAADRADPVTKSVIESHRPTRQSGPSHLLRRTRLNHAAGGWRRVISAAQRRGDDG